MAKVIIKVRVAYPEKLLQAFSSQGLERRSGGEGAAIICYLPEDPNITYFILDWDSVESAKHFWASNTGKSHIAKWNAVDPIEILNLEEFIQK